MNYENKNIINKRNKFLIIYGIISFVISGCIIWLFSFNWVCIYNVSINTLFLISFLFVCLLGSLIYDSKTKKGTKWFFIISLIQLIILTGISIPITKWQIDSSLNKAQNIIIQLGNYKKRFNEYPETLLELEEKMEIKIPKRTNLGTKYQYDTDTTGTFYISFISYFGKRAIYNKSQNRWTFVD